jgi:hypothetical protein
VVAPLTHDVLAFYRDALTAASSALRAGSMTYVIDRSSERWSDLQAWSREVVWYGQQEGRLPLRQPRRRRGAGGTLLARCATGRSARPAHRLRDRLRGVGHRRADRRRRPRTDRPPTQVARDALRQRLRPRHHLLRHRQRLRRRPQRGADRRGLSAAPRDRVVIATKAGRPVYADRPDYSGTELRARSRAASAASAPTTSICFQLPRSVTGALRDGDALATLDRLLPEGKIRAVGVSARTPDDGPRRRARPAACAPCR